MTRAWAGMVAAGLAFSAGPLLGQEVGGRPSAPEVRGILRAVTPIPSINQNDAAGFASLGEFVQVDTILGVVQLETGVLDPFDGASPSTWFYVSDGTGSPSGEPGRKPGPQRASTQGGASGDLLSYFRGFLPIAKKITFA